MPSSFEGFVLKRDDRDTASRSAWRRVDIDLMSSGSFKKLMRQVERGDVDAEKQLRAVDGHFVRDQVRMWLAYRNDQERNLDCVWYVIHCRLFMVSLVIPSWYQSCRWNASKVNADMPRRTLGALNAHRKSTVQNATLFRDKRITYTDSIDVLLHRKTLPSKSTSLPRSARWSSDFEAPNPVVRSILDLSRRTERDDDSRLDLSYPAFLRGGDTTDQYDGDSFFSAPSLERWFEELSIARMVGRQRQDRTARRRQDQIEDDEQLAKRLHREHRSSDRPLSRLADGDVFLSYQDN